MKRALLLFPLLCIAFSLSSFDSYKPANKINAYPQIVPSNLEIGNALKEALQQGTGKSADRLGSQRFFWQCGS